MGRSVPASALALCLCTCPVFAQLAGPALSWSGSSGGFASGFLPYCADLPVAAVPGETVTVTVWGDRNAAFVLLAAAGGTQCLLIPGIFNQLVLDFPVVSVAAGTLAGTSPCRTCPPGVQALTFPVPFGLPPGTALALQGLSYGAGILTFTIAITGTV